MVAVNRWRKLSEAMRQPNNNQVWWRSYFLIPVMIQVQAGVQTVPLLLLHGWPGSVREFDAAIPLLTAISKDRDFALELIVPSLPGYGFSSVSSTWSEQYGQLNKELIPYKTFWVIFYWFSSRNCFFVIMAWRYLYFSSVIKKINVQS